MDTTQKPARHPDADKPVRTLQCCCCGGYTKGRQFYNQDTGHGLGDCCVDFVTPRTEDMQRTYGVAGVHYRVGVPGIDQPEQGNSAT